MTVFRQRPLHHVGYCKTPPRTRAAPAAPHQHLRQELVHDGRRLVAGGDEHLGRPHALEVLWQTRKATGRKAPPVRLAGCAGAPGHVACCTAPPRHAACCKAQLLSFQGSPQDAVRESAQRALGRCGACGACAAPGANLPAAHPQTHRPPRLLPPHRRPAAPWSRPSHACSQSSAGGGGVSGIGSSSAGGRWAAGLDALRHEALSCCSSWTTVRLLRSCRARARQRAAACAGRRAHPLLLARRRHQPLLQRLFILLLPLLTLRLLGFLRGAGRQDEVRGAETGRIRRPASSAMQHRAHTFC